MKILLFAIPWVTFYMLYIFGPKKLKRPDTGKDPDARFDKKKEYKDRIINFDSKIL